MVNKRSALSVLVAHHDPAVLRLITVTLQTHGFPVAGCSDGESALHKFSDDLPRLVILDTHLPFVDGLTVCRRIRAASTTPIVMVASHDNQRDAAVALEAGADDYIRTPFGPEELVARVRAVFRRAYAGLGASDTIVIGPLEIDTARLSARIGGAELMLSSTEFALLSYLASNSDRVLTHERILKAVWGEDYVDARHMLRVTMCRLRQKLAGSSGGMIRTLPRVGYRFVGARQAA